jgi:hypothetical protein
MMTGAMGRYGMGWDVAERHHTRFLSHGGIAPDFSAYVALLPDERKGVVLLFNVNHAAVSLSLAEVGAGVSDLIAGHEPDPLRFGFIPWVLRGLLLLAVLQIVGIVGTLQRRLCRRCSATRTIARSGDARGCAASRLR